MQIKYLDIVTFIQSIYGKGNIPLHRPVFSGNEKKYLSECIDSNFVSSAGSRVEEFENLVSSFVGSRYAIATTNGTSALHTALILVGVNKEDEVVTQSLTFIATCNAISYTGAKPVFVDVDIDTMGMSPSALALFLDENAERRNQYVWNKKTGRRISACVPMHTFGLPCRINEILDICNLWGIPLIEDAAESLGSYHEKRHLGTFGIMGTFSFNGNKVITTGGGGMIVTNNKVIADRAKHITTTAKIPHSFEFFHDEIGFNYRLPNLNAALGCAQMEQLPTMLAIKRKVTEAYIKFFSTSEIKFVTPLIHSQATHWLNAIILPNKEERDAFILLTNQNGVMTRPIWRLMSELPMYRNCINDGLKNSSWLEQRVVNIPSGVPDDPSQIP